MIVRWMAASLAAVVLALSPAVPALAGAHHHKPGRVLSAEPLPASLWLPGAAAAHRIRYTSTGLSGRPVAVAGAVFIPEGTAPRHGWPVISWAHGTVGVADGCAQSVGGRSDRDVTYLSAWLRAGYAVVATEYEGLGTPGPHPYLHGASEAYGVIDMVRAARTVARSLGRTWLAVGQSQGGQAVLFAGAVADRYAPELDYRGAIATAPPSQWRTLIDVARAFEPSAPAIPNVLLILEMLRAAHPHTFDPAGYLTPAGAELFTRARTELCFTELAEQLAGRTAGDVYDVDAAERERLTRLMEYDADIPIVRHRRPVFIAQGTADTVVHPPASKTTADQLAAAGTDVTFRFYPGADHSGPMTAALPELLAWAAAQTRR